VLTVVVLCASVLFQVTAAIAALRLIKTTNRSLAWGLISAGLFLMTVRRWVPLYSFLVTPSAPHLDLGIEILLVEDNPDDVLLTQRAFSKSNIGNDIVVKRDGQEALDYLFGLEGVTAQEGEALPVLVLLDIKLPRIDGLEVLRRMRGDERTRLLPVVILTSSNEYADLVAGYQRGCNSYIRKPVDFNQFADAVRQLGVCWLVLNEAPGKSQAL
jgi:two-component system response regulator